MSGFIKKKKKPLLSRITGKVMGVPLPSENQYISPDVPLNNIHIEYDVMNTIATRRNELKDVNHGNTDAVVTFNDSS